MRVNPNRMELLKLRRRRDVAKRGHKLLKDKFDELLKEFISRISENRRLRAEVEAELAAAYGLFAVARGEAGRAVIDEALGALGAVAPKMLELAAREKAIELLAAEIERTRRRVNALEYVLIPSIDATAKDITMKLDEAERSNLTRLMKVKDMIAQQEADQQQPGS
jgi:V/A-type H+-transporting ATPase subunit D